MQLPPPGEFRLHVPDQDLDELRSRLAATRWPRDAVDAGWRYGPPPGELQHLTALWRDHEWRARETRLNRHHHVRIACNGLALHAMTVSAAEPAAPTVVLLHGWPSSFIEMSRLAEALARPADGGRPVNAVAVSLPGYAPSDGLPVPGLSERATAVLLVHLLDGLGLDQVWLHAHDMAADPAVRLALDHPGRVLGYHTTEPGLPRAAWPLEQLKPEEREYLELSARWDVTEGGYARVLATRPASLATALTDSPAGLAAWTFDKWRSWTVADGDDWEWDSPLTGLLLDTLTLQWCAGGTAGANRTYYVADSGYTGVSQDDRLTCPVGVTLTAQQIERAPRRLVERLFPDIRTWTDLGTGGHFIAGEKPDLLAASIRRFLDAATG